MDLENKIKELQKQLAIKNAYLNVDIKFKKGVQIPQDVKKLVTEELTKACAQLAEGVDYEASANTTDLTDEDVVLLKELANKLRSKVNKKAPVSNGNGANSHKVAQEESEISKAIKKVTANKARLMLLDNIDPEIRRKLEPNSLVKIIGKRGDTNLVEDENKNRFLVPIEDLDFNLE